VAGFPRAGTLVRSGHSMLTSLILKLGLVTGGRGEQDKEELEDPAALNKEALYACNLEKGILTYLLAHRRLLRVKYTQAVV